MHEYAYVFNTMYMYYDTPLLMSPTSSGTLVSSFF